MSETSDKLFTPISTHGLNPKGQLHLNSGWEYLHKKSVQLEEAILTYDGVLLATTGERTGRSPNDRFIVKEPGLADDVWWGDVNRSTTPYTFEILLDKIQEHLNNVDNLFIKDAFCGADINYRMPVRLITEKAWHAAFMHNMFIRPTSEEISKHCLLYTSPSPRDRQKSRMPSSA